MNDNSLYGRVSRVENFFSMLLTKNEVSKQIFISQLPVTIKPDWNDMVLIDVGKGENLGALRRYSVNIFLYGKLADSQAEGITGDSLEFIRLHF